MNDGYYRITSPKGDKEIVEVYGNSTRLGSVHRLQMNYLFEEVQVFTKEELERYVNEEVTKRK